jgi:N-acyl-D-aspartate/D-glutamate deacylase
MKPDLVIRGGTVVDGTGRPPVETDVVVAGDRIAGVGAYTGPVVRAIDARGKIVTPGFVDVHTHLDAQIIWDPRAAVSVEHGVTSVVVGNCGVGFAPCRPQDRDYLMFLMEGVEDIPQAALRAGLTWEWETFPEYLDALARRPASVNVGAHLSHAPLRVYAMGERGATDARPTDEELARMRACIGEALRAGALGVATGRTTMHRTPGGDPVPGTFADRRELDMIGAALREAGTGVFQLVPYGGGGEDPEGFAREYEWLLPVAQATGRPFSVVTTQHLKYPDGWKEVFRLAEAAAQEGADIRPQVAARSVGILIGSGISVSPLLLFPAAGDLLGKSLDETRRLLQDPALRAHLVDSFDETNAEVLGGLARLENVFPLEGNGVLAYDVAPDRSVVAVGRRQRKHPGQVILDLMLAHDLENFFILPLFNVDLDVAASMLEHPRSTIGLGDAGAHTTQTCDVGFPTFMLAYWVRERQRFSLEQAVRMLTLDVADVWGLPGRGVIRQGACADLNVIDLDRLDLEFPEVHHDLPTGAPNLWQGAKGYVSTIVNGTIVMEGGTHTGALPGTVLRNTRALSSGPS